MSRTVKVHTIIRKDPPVGEVICLAPGDSVPDWALDQVGDHLFNPTTGATPPATPRTGIPDVPKAPDPEAEPLTVPAIGAHVSTWRKYGEALGLEFAKGTTRVEIQKAIWESHPDMMPEGYEPEDEQE